VLAVAVVALGSCVGLAVAASDPAERGKTLYEQSCASCHTLGGGDTAGPDLEGVMERRDAEFVRRFIAEPAAVIAEGDPEVKAMVEKFGGVQMPDLGLPAADVDAIVAYLAAQSGAAAPGTTTAPAETQTAPTETTATETEASRGDVATGEELFNGEQAFANGGAPCLSCHSIAGTGALGGGKLGPDLSDAWEKFGGAAGFAAVLTTLPFPTMVPIYQDNPLTKDEAADVAAYMETTSGEEPDSSATWLFVALGVGVTVILLGLALLIWPRRRLVVRKELVPTSGPRRRT
jgi:cytochrome c2